MADLVALETELDTDPLARGYDAMNDQQAADSLNAVNRTVPAIVDVSDVREYLQTQLNGSGVTARSAIDMIREYAEDGTVRGVSAAETAPEARRSGAMMIWHTLQWDTGRFLVDDTNVRNQFIAISSDGGDGPGVLTSSQLTAIDAMATRSVSRAIEVEIGDVLAGHVTNVRA